MARSQLVLEFDRSGLHAVEVVVGRGGVRVIGSATATRPVGVAVDDPRATGGWIREVLAEAGLRGRRVLVALPRDAAAVKHPVLPAADPAELPSMVALAVGRDLPFPADAAVLDFVPLAATVAVAAAAAERPAATNVRTAVLAAAIPRERLEAVVATIAAAGRTLVGVTLRSLGSAALLQRLDAASDGRELILDVGDRGLELLVLERGGLRFARAADLPPPSGDPAARVAAILTETRRTWLSYRMAEDADVSRAAILGPPALAEALVPELATLLGVPVRRLDPASAAEADTAIAARVLQSGGWPLVGLTLTAPEERLDWLHPRRVPDRRREAIRRGALVAVLLGILAGGAWSLARKELADLRGQLASLRQQRSEVAGDHARLQRDIARRTHLRKWAEVYSAWLEHLARFEAAMPPAGELVLDGIGGSLAWRGVDFDRRSRQWSAPYELTFVIDGEAASRAAAESLRGAFVSTDLYRVSSTGSDGAAGRRLPVGFTWRLSTRAASPPPTPPSAAPATAPDPGAAEPAS